uniref:Uncharacterized protein n=1 Tax=Cynoglossus semilaevis TaxID=244447 RepID=A0A3P8VEP6_CYNSE
SDLPKEMAATNAPPQSRNLPWVEKYRPQKLDDLISHKDILSTRQTPSSLVLRPPATGKTSTILACAKQLYKGKEFNSMVLEVWRITPFLLNRIGFILSTLSLP